MKTKLKFFAFIVGVFSLLNTSCNHLCKPTIHHTITNDTIRKLSTFYKGSFFVYKDSISGQIDSFSTANGSYNYIASLPTVSFNRCNEPYDDYEVNGVDFTKDTFHYNYFHNIGYSITSNVGRVDLSMNTNQYEFQAPLYYLNNSQINNCTFLPTFSMNNKTYNSVYSIVSSYSSTDTVTTYINQDIGLLKYAYKSDTQHFVFELINYSSLK